MDSRPDALYSAISRDLKEVTPFGPVGLGELPPDASYRQVAASLLWKSIFKKWTPKSQDSADNLAIEKFLASNKTCKDWKYQVESSIDETIDGEIRRSLDNFFHPGGSFLFGYQDILDRGRVGPGAAVGARGFSFYAKMCASPLTTTSLDLYHMYRRWTARDQTSDHAEFVRFSEYGSACLTDCSSMSLVPKTSEISRLICVEPSLNVFFQLGLGQVLEERLRSYFGIDLGLQPDKNRALACWGSRDGSLATIDLESASDSISLSFCKEFLPSWVFDTLLEIRSPRTKLKGIEYTLEMMSTMGNGFTFPLQTIIFSSMIEAVYRVKGIPFTKGFSNWSCFGDDIIIRSDCYELFVRTLSRLGFRVNRLKSFFEGPFRESCGADWLYGQPVRPVYIRSLDTPQDISVAVNLLNGWTSYTGIPVRESVQLLLGWIRTPLYVPFFENMDAGVRVPSIFFDKRLRTDKNGTAVYSAYRSRPISFRVEDDRLLGPRRFKKLSWNPDGILLSLLRGEIRNGKLLVRNNWVSYSVRLVRSPWWDYVQTGTRFNGHLVSWPRWETSVLINLSNPA